MPTKKKKRAAAPKRRQRKPAKTPAQKKRPSAAERWPPPAGLGDVGRQYWAKLVRHFERPADVMEPLEALCREWEEFQRCARLLAEDPRRATFTTKSGFERPSPLATSKQRALGNMLRLWKQLLLPVAKAPDRDDWLERFAASKYDDEEDLNAGII